MTAPHAQVRDYAELQAAFRELATKRGLTREDIDAQAKFPDRYAAKLLAPEQIKSIGPKSLGPLLRVLGVYIALIDDPEAKRIAVRTKPLRNASMPMLPLRRRRRRAHHHKGNAEWSKRANSFRALKISRIKRSRIARQAARARWRKRP